MVINTNFYCMSNRRKFAKIRRFEQVWLQGEESNDIGKLGRPTEEITRNCHVFCGLMRNLVPYQRKL